MHSSSSSSRSDADINSINNRNISQLQICSRDGDLHGVLRALASGADANQVSSYNTSDPYIDSESKKLPLLHAVERKHFQIAQILLMAGSDSVSVLRDMTVDPALLRAVLFWAIKDNAVLLVKKMLPSIKNVISVNKSEVRIDINEEKSNVFFREDTFTEEDVAAFIEYACYLNFTECAELLLMLGVPLRENSSIRCAGYWAAKNNNDALYEAVSHTENAKKVLLQQLLTDKLYQTFGEKLTAANKNSVVAVDPAKINLTPLDVSSIQSPSDVDVVLAEKDWVNFSLYLDSSSDSLQHYYANRQLMLLRFICKESPFDLFFDPECLEDYKKDIAKEFPGIFAIFLTKKLVRESLLIYLDAVEKQHLAYMTTSAEEKAVMVQRYAKDTIRHFDMSATASKIVLADMMNIFSIPHEFYIRNKFTDCVDTAHLIINYLNANEQHVFEQTNRYNRRLVHEPVYRERRIAWREHGRQMAEAFQKEREKNVSFIAEGDKFQAEYLQLVTKLFLLNKFLDQVNLDVPRQGFFSHRMLKNKKRDLFFLFYTLALIAFLIWDIKSFVSVNNENNAIKDALSDVKLESLPWSCLNYVDFGDDFGCRTQPHRGWIWPMPAECQILCDEKLSIYPVWAGTLAGLVIGNFLLLCQLIMKCHSDIYDIRGVERFDDVDISVLSVKLAALQRRLLHHFQNDLNISLNGKTTVGAYKGLFFLGKPALEQRKIVLEEQLRIYRPAALEMVEEDNEVEESLLPAIENGNPTIPLLRRGSRG